jgi:hypothetical protein
MFAIFLFFLTLAILPNLILRSAERVSKDESHQPGLVLRDACCAGSSA